MTNTRSAAVSSLTEVLTREGRPKQSIEDLSHDFDRRDRAFTMEIVYGVLRNLYCIDWIIARFVKNTGRVGEVTLNNLRTGVYQIFFMRVPDFAVVNEAVDLEKDGGKPSLVNAVLRNIIRSKKELPLPIPVADPVKSLSINTSHQEWMIRRWIERYGMDEARSLAEADNNMPALVIRANTLRISRASLLAELAHAGIQAAATGHSPDGLIIRGRSSYRDLHAFHGLFAVQDEASQLVSYLLSPQPGERVLDACAAPGGKTTHLSQLMKDTGEIIALEKDPRRLKRVEENILALGTRIVTVRQADAGEPGNTDSYDRILLDAPCSSTGVIRRNPDVKYRHKPGDLTAFRKTQSRLLAALSRLVKPGGRLVYSVCSMEPEEGDDVVGGFLKTAGDFRMIEADHAFLAPFMKDGRFRTYPHKHDMDGFFGVILCRKK